MFVLVDIRFEGLAQGSPDTIQGLFHPGFHGKQGLDLGARVIITVRTGLHNLFFSTFPDFTHIAELEKSAVSGFTSITVYVTGCNLGIILLRPVSGYPLPFVIVILHGCNVGGTLSTDQPAVCRHWTTIIHFISSFGFFL